MAPRSFSIILPVRNGGGYLRVCVESILAQTHRDLDLAILDNRGAVAEIDWIRRLGDSRVRIFPAARDLSIEDNWRRTLEIPKNEFMAFVGADDLLDPHFLRVMDELIARFPEAGLYQAHFRLIDEHGALIRRCLPMPARETAADFLAARLVRIRDSFGTGYVMRARDYDAVGGMPGYTQLLYADDALWLTLMRGGWKATAAEECFAYRVHSESASGGWNPVPRLAALEAYAAFLGGLRQSDPACAKVLDRYGSDFFTPLCRRLFVALLLEASNADCLPADTVRRRLDGVTRLVLPHGPGEWSGVGSFRLLVRALQVVRALPGRRAVHRAAVWAFRVTKPLRARQRPKGGG
jgi:glycosyltransferase involved in cell wall biosynthesis